MCLSSYRHHITDEEEIEQKAEERRRKGQDPDWDVILNRTAVSPLVVRFMYFVYCICGFSININLFVKSLAHLQSSP